MTVNTPKVFIVVLNWNGWEDTNECLASLMKLGYPNFKILVVDNASTDASVSNIQQEFPKIRILQMSENRGYAAGNNEGIRYAMDHGADYIWILNNDTVIEPDSLWPLVKKMEKNKSIGMCGSLLKDYYQTEQVQALGGGRYYKWLGITRLLLPQTKGQNSYEVENIEQSLDFILGASMFVSKKFVDSTGLMNENYFLFYEEIDWAVRSKQTYKLGFAPKSVVYHKLNATLNIEKEDGQKRSKRVDYFQIKNRLKFTRSYYIRYLPTVYLTVIYALIKRLLKGQGENAVMILKLMFSYQK
jgi:GT2 family glycosyltransferase